MSRYISRAELEKVIRATVAKAGIDPKQVVMSRVLRGMRITGDRYYGWTCALDVDPVALARQHSRKPPPAIAPEGATP